MPGSLWSSFRRQVGRADHIRAELGLWLTPSESAKVQRQAGEVKRILRGLFGRTLERTLSRDFHWKPERHCPRDFCRRVLLRCFKQLGLSVAHRSRRVSPEQLWAVLIFRLEASSTAEIGFTEIPLEWNRRCTGILRAFRLQGALKYVLRVIVREEIRRELGVAEVEVGVVLTLVRRLFRRFLSERESPVPEVLETWEPEFVTAWAIFRSQELSAGLRRLSIVPNVYPL